MPKSVFESLNEARADAGEALFANPRNAAAGSLRQLNSKITASRRLDIFIFNLQEGSLYLDGREAKTHTESLDRLAELGFSDVEFGANIRESQSGVEIFGQIRYNKLHDRAFGQRT